MYPISLSLKGHPCLVVGGGGVALRKVQGLLRQGAGVTVVASEVIAPLAALAQLGDIYLERRAYLAGEAKGFDLVFAATDDREVNRRVYTDANEAHVFVNVADDPELCTFHLPSRIERGALQIAISSGGKAPFVTRRLRQRLERRFGEEWGAWVDRAARFRKRVKGLQVSREQEEALFDAFFDATVDSNSLVTRVPSEKEEVLWLGSVGAQDTVSPARASVEPREAGKEARGLVSLVGAGPGDPGLLTLRGRERLLRADAVVCDRLAVPALPCDLPAACELHFVGKEAGYHPVPQNEINALLVRLAKEGKRVVRLKGGDPYVFGRGGEEVMVLVEANIPFEVVPGATAAVAVTAYAGIPVTFRQEVVRVTMVTAHESIKSGGPQVRWDLLAQDPHAMILGYMGVTHLPKIIAHLIEAGMDPKTPAALIERGTTVMQRTVRSTIGCLQEDVMKAGLGPPALFAIGPTVRYAESLDWFGKRPLLGERLVAFDPAPDLVEALDLNGAAVIPLRSPVTQAARMVMDALPITGCILKSPEETDLMEEERDRKSWTKEPNAWCLTKATAMRARDLMWPRVVEIEGEPRAGALLAAMIDRRSQ